MLLFLNIWLLYWSKKIKTFGKILCISSLQKLNFVKNKVKEILNQKQLKTNPKIIVVTKTFPLNKITPS